MKLFLKLFKNKFICFLIINAIKSSTSRRWPCINISYSTFSFGNLFSQCILLTFDARYRDTILGIGHQYGAYFCINVGVLVAHPHIRVLHDGHVVAAGAGAFRAVFRYQCGWEECGNNLELFLLLQLLLNQLWLRCSCCFCFSCSENLTEFPKVRNLLAQCKAVGTQTDIVELATSTLFLRMRMGWVQQLLAPLLETRGQLFSQCRQAIAASCVRHAVEFTSECRHRCDESVRIRFETTRLSAACGSPFCARHSPSRAPPFSLSCTPFSCSLFSFAGTRSFESLLTREQECE